MSDAKFQAIKRDDKQRFGTRAILLCGYSREELKTVRQLLQNIGVQDVRVLMISEELLGMTLGRALETVEQQRADSDELVQRLPRILLFSGLTGQEVHSVMDQYKSTGLPRPIFASATEHSVKLPLPELITELISEQRAMMAKRNKGKVNG